MELRESVILYSTITVLIATILIIISYIYYYYHHSNKKKRISDYIEKYQDNWYQILYLNERTKLPPLKHRHEQNAAEQILFSFLLNGISENVRTNISNIATKYLSKQYKEDLYAVSWSTRVNTLYKISKFNVRGFHDFYTIAEIHQLSDEEHHLFLSYLSRYDFNMFLRALLHKKALSEHHCLKILNSIDDEYVIAMKVIREKMPINHKFAYINRLSYIRTENVLPILEYFLEDENEEVRIRTLKALLNYGAIGNPQKYRKFFSSKVWQERYFAVQLTKLSEGDFIEELKERTNDEKDLIRDYASERLKYEMRYIN